MPTAPSRPSRPSGWAELKPGRGGGAGQRRWSALANGARCSSRRAVAIVAWSPCARWRRGRARTWPRAASSAPTYTKHACAVGPARTVAILFRRDDDGDGPHRESGLMTGIACAGRRAAADFTSPRGVGGATTGVRDGHRDDTATRSTRCPRTDAGVAAPMERGRTDREPGRVAQKIFEPTTRPAPVDARSQSVENKGLQRCDRPRCPLARRRRGRATRTSLRVAT